MSDEQLLKDLLQELRVSNEELRASRDEYEKRNKELQREAEKIKEEVEGLKSKKPSDKTNIEYKSIFENVHLPFMVCKLLFDEHGEPLDFEFKEANQAYLDWVGRPKEEIIGKEAATIFENYRNESDWFPRMIEVATTGQPQLTKQPSSLYDKWLHIGMHSPGKHEVAMLVMDVTKEKEAENKSLLSDAQLNLALEMEMIAIWEWVIPEDRVENYNEFWKELYQFENKNTSQQFYARIHEEDAKAAQDALEAHIAGITENFHQLYRLWNPEKTAFKWIRNSGKVIEWDKEGNPVRIIGTSTDITEQKEAEQKLGRTTHELNRAQSLSKIGSWFLDLETNEVSWTEEIYRMYGFESTKPPPPYTEHMKLFTEESWNTLSSELDKTAKQGIPYDLELEMASGHASFGWMRAIGEAVYNDSGKIIGLRGTAQDITEKKRRQVELEKTTEALENAQNLSKMGNWYYDIITGEVEWTEQVYRIFGLDPELPPVPFPEQEDYYTAESWPNLVEAADKALEEGIPYDLELELKPADQKGSRWLRSIGVPVLDKQKKVIGLRGVAQDITEVKEITQRLKKEKKFAEAVMEGSAAGTYIFDIQEKKNVFANNRTEEMLGFSPVELREMSSETFISRFHKDDLPNIFAHFEKVNSSKEPQKIKYRFKHKKGHYVTCIGIDAPYEFDEFGDLKSYIGSFIDISELQKTEEELIKAKNEAVAANKQKDLFLSNMSHEIRTPLNGVIGFSRLLKRENLSSDERGSYLEQIEDNSHQLMILIDDILSLSKLESGQIVIDKQPVSMERLISNLAENHRQQLLSRQDKENLEIKINAPENPVLNVLTDGVRLSQVINNLVTNAIKFSTKGTIEIGYKGDCESGLMQVWVKDEGLGIKKEDQKHIFNRFSQINQRLATQMGGIGLGLAISDAIVELLGGTIRLHSKYRKGSTFTVEIPLECANDAPKLGAKPKKVEKLIIADDSPSVQFYYRSLLKGLSLDMLLAQDGEEVLKLLREHKDTDLILMDMRMPKMDGPTALKELRKFNKNVRVVAQSAFATEDQVQEFQDMGFDEYITKPVNEERILRLIGHDS